ncbi:GSCOCG00001875001-RA-CDS, partial [Cotesia congregata]
LDWEKVLSVLGRVVTECNEGARLAGRQIEMASLAKKIEYTTKVPSIDLRDRYLVRSGPVTQILAKPGTEYVLTFRKKFHKTPLYLLLLTDHLLIAKLKSK